MLNQISRLSLLLVFAIAMVFTSCQKEDIALTDNYTTDTGATTMSRGGGPGGKQGPKGESGPHGASCYEIVFPVTIAFPDGTQATLADEAAAKEAKMAWKENNPDATERPSLVFPIDIDQDGTVSSIADEEALKAVREACKEAGRGEMGGKGDRGGMGDKGGKGDRGDKEGNRCFQPIFPLTIEFSDGTTVDVADEDAARAAGKAWKEANPDTKGRPSFVLPFDVELSDGSIITIATQEDLDALKAECGGPDRGERPRGGKGGQDGPRGGHGDNHLPCFKPVYPITITVDGAPITIEDEAGKREAIMAWVAANPDATERPTIELSFPITVELEDGTTVDINSEEELEALEDTCDRPDRGGERPRGGKGGQDGPRGGHLPCFKPVYPITITVDGAPITIEDEAGKREAIMAWVAANPDATERPTIELSFPISVELEDGTTVEINSQEDLEALKDTCRAN